MSDTKTVLMIVLSGMVVVLAYFALRVWELEKKVKKIEIQSKVNSVLATPKRPPPFPRDDGQKCEVSRPPSSLLRSTGPPQCESETAALSFDHAATSPSFARKEEVVPSSCSSPALVVEEIQKEIMQEDVPALRTSPEISEEVEVGSEGLPEEFEHEGSAPVEMIEDHGGEKEKEEEKEESKKKKKSSRRSEK